MKTLFVMVLLAWVMAVPARAQWAANGKGACTAALGQDQPKAAPDGSGGVIIVWHEHRNAGTSGVDVYAQRLDKNGFVQWAAGGIPVCTEMADQMFLGIVSDGAGGAIVAWGDTRSGSATLYAQRLSSSGTLLWAASGVPLFIATPEQNFPVIVTDGANGAIVACLDSRLGTYSIFAQRVNAAGVVQWNAAGVAVSTALGLHHYFAVADGVGGAIFGWSDDRNGAGDVFAQRINAAGTVQWAPNGVTVCNAALVQDGGTLASDGAGGAIIAWVDGRLGAQLNRQDIYAQRVNAAGLPQWTANGVAVCSVFGEQAYPELVSDGAGGAIVAWQDRRAANWDVYAQRVNSAGAMQWTVGGVALCTNAGTQQFVQVIADGSNGAVVAWPDLRDGSGENDVYAQRVDGAGTVRWTTDGVALCALPREQQLYQIVSDGAGGVLGVWDDQRSWDGVQFPPSDYYDVYAGHVTGSGWAVTGVTRAPSARAGLTPNVPNPFSETTRFDLVLEHDARVAVDVYDVSGKKVRHIDIDRAPAGRTTIVFDGRDSRGYSLPSGQYFYRVAANGTQLAGKMLILR